MRHMLRHTILLLVLLAGCATPMASEQSTPTPALADELVFYDWAADFPPELLADFTREYGIAVRYVEYGSQEEAIAQIAAGASFDLVVMGNEFIPLMVADGLLAELDHNQLPNFKHISPNFRDLAYDPGNRYSMPYSWGTTGLLIDEGSSQQVTSWGDLWDPAYAGQVVIWGIPRHMIAMALKSLGYSANSEDPAELAEAGRRLAALKPALLGTVDDNDAMAELFASGGATIAVGYAGDVLNSRAAKLAVGYVLPEEGALLWGDNYVVPASSPRKAEAQLLLNYLLRPESGAAIVNYNYYATPNEAARPLLDPALRDDPVIFPPDEELHNAEIILPLSAEGQARYDQLWAELFD